MLLANGHPEARSYPIGMVWDEARLVAERQNRRMASEAVLLQMAVSSVLSEEGGKAFKAELERLSDG